MNITLTETQIPGCFELLYCPHLDDRGTFVKTFQYEIFSERELETGFVETFSTTSGVNVLRGMHLQLPPADHAKLVYCLSGHVQDVVLDLRRGSPMYGEHRVVELSA